MWKSTASSILTTTAPGGHLQAAGLPELKNVEDGEIENIWRRHSDNDL
ncbi:hypothetical protein [Otoolea muris]|nr:hypothetical protein [Otoolea muris]